VLFYGGGDDVKLTEKQKRFADYYIETGNATESAVRAGYSEKTAKEMGYENLTKPHIRLYVNQRIAEKDNNRIAKQEEVLEFLTNVLRGEETEKIPMFAKDHFELIDNTPSIRDRTKAAELLGKRYTLWTDKTQLEGSIGVTIVDDIDD
jgi:phage terminase small subunit